MRCNAALVRWVRGFAVSLVLLGTGPALPGAEVTLTRTNAVERWITNVIDVTMPVNRFVNEYRTNWITQLRTNIVDVYTTNWMMRRATNQIEVAATWTNFATAFHTNWTTRTLTNHLAVERLRTNLVDCYHTNWSVLNLTNWETVVLFKTNWIVQPLTNLVQMNLAAPPPIARAPVRAGSPPKASWGGAAASTPISGWRGPLTIEAARTTRPPANNLVEVRLRVRWNGHLAAPVQIQNWRIEREDGAIILVGQDSDFKQQLQAGTYKVEAKVRAEGDNPPATARGTLSVTTREAVIEQQLLVKR